MSHYGVIRVIDHEILWLTTGGKFREYSELTWRAAREDAFLRARRVRGLMVRHPDPVKEQPETRQDARQRVFNVIPLPDQRKIAPGSPEALEFARKLREWRKSLKES